MDIASLKILQTFNGRCIDANIESITHETSLIAPDDGGNCVNWIVGHVVNTRNMTLSLVGERAAWDEEYAGLYGRGTPPISAVDAVDFFELADLERRTRDIVLQAFDLVSADLLAMEADDKTFGATVGQQLAALQWHEGYHVGQLAVLRRIVGLEGAIT